ncbi:tyrosine-protein phosphatase [Arthrobacter gengyunqii]|uniref:Tyrosine-protein phosphatase n=1 Tax=Arthrobacter gengyunqii TaxID=2886940 RepID=A0ABS8GJ09_9MICC|nr:tyrosine-protein phosphatase [Arthrobacter gengyunqii]MCC3265233.1 tyrosine-protein phosphatase [Arthrobacter gengyunqii]
MTMKLEWAGLANARDLGGIPLGNGGYTVAGAFARSDHPQMLTPAGWDQLASYGIRTVVSLETGGLEGEAAFRANRPVEAPEHISAELLRVPIEDGSDDDFMERWARTGLWGTPLYFKDALERWPELHGTALNVLGTAERPVLVHCGRGHDRTGIMSLLLLTVAGATGEGITEDYLQSARNLQAREPSAVEKGEAALQRAGTTALECIQGAMAAVTDDWLRGAGVETEALANIRSSLPGDDTTVF